MKKLFLIILTMVIFNPNHAFSQTVSTKNTGWVLKEGKWYYYKLNNKKINWQYINNKWYYFASGGAMKTGWSLYKNKWYFLDQNGSMKTGWFYYKDFWYFLQNDGSMRTGWFFNHDNWYFFDSSGKMLIGWNNINGSWYYFDRNGTMHKGWLSLEGKSYYLKENGIMAKDWLTLNSKMYYFYPGGYMAKNERISGYYIGYKGEWIKDTTDPYYLNGVLLVNRYHGIPATYAPGESKEARSAFETMKKDASLEGLSLTIVSTYRSYLYQSRLYSSYVKKYGQEAADRFSAKPGFSEHQTGLAFDIGSGNPANAANEGFTNTLEAKWLASNAYKYGFILRYPPEKEWLTGYMYESWHYRFVGKEVAAQIFKSGLTLEEYLGEY